MFTGIVEELGTIAEVTDVTVLPADGDGEQPNVRLTLRPAAGRIETPRESQI